MKCEHISIKPTWNSESHVSPLIHYPTHTPRARCPSRPHARCSRHASCIHPVRQVHADPRSRQVLADAPLASRRLPCFRVRDALTPRARPGARPSSARRPACAPDFRSRPLHPRSRRTCRASFPWTRSSGKSGTRRPSWSSWTRRCALRCGSAPSLPCEK